MFSCWLRVCIIVICKCLLATTSHTPMMIYLLRRLVWTISGRANTKRRFALHSRFSFRVYGNRQPRNGRDGGKRLGIAQILYHNNRQRNMKTVIQHLRGVLSVPSLQLRLSHRQSPSESVQARLQQPNVTPHLSRSNLQSLFRNLSVAERRCNSRS